MNGPVIRVLKQDSSRVLAYQGVSIVEMNGPVIRVLKQLLSKIQNPRSKYNVVEMNGPVIRVLKQGIKFALKHLILGVK